MAQTWRGRRDHPGRAVVEIARAECQHLAGAHGGSQEHLDDVAHLSVGFRARQARFASPARGGHPDRGDLFKREGLRLALRVPQRRGAGNGVARHRVVPQGESEEQVQQGPRLPGPRGGDRGLRLEEPLDSARGDLRERVMLELRQDVQAYLVPVVLLGPFSEPLDGEVGQPYLSQVSESALWREDPGAAERGPIQEPFLEDLPCLSRGSCGHPDVPQPAVRVADPGFGDHPVTPAP
jgi:hypothetical protein